MRKDRGEGEMDNAFDGIGRLFFAAIGLACLCVVLAVLAIWGWVT